VISRFECRNFRGFQEIRLRGLRRVNIVVGGSGSGKTALLEALRLGLGGTAQIAYELQVKRGIPQGVPSFLPAAQVFSAAQVFEEFWGSLFGSFDLSEPIEFQSELLPIGDEQPRQAQLTIRMGSAWGTAQLIGAPPQPSWAGSPPPVTGQILPIIFERVNFVPGITEKTEASLNLQAGFLQLQLQLPHGAGLVPVSEVLNFDPRSNPAQAVQWFSSLDVLKNAKEVTDFIRKEFPEIGDLSIAVLQGAPCIVATMQHLPRKIPISLVSSAASKLVLILSGIRNFQGGVVLIDEIENGLHYSLLPKLWSALYQFAKDSDVQLFLSTHSQECLRAAAELMQDPDRAAAEDFALIQVHQRSGRSLADLTPGPSVAEAIASGLEIRKR
jgi:hypothetical protein